MEIKRNKYDSKKEFDLLTGMIVSDKFITEILPIFHPKYLTASSSKLVSRWCVEYYQKYGKAPKENIQELFQSKMREGQQDEVDIELVEKFLSNLSERFENIAEENYNHVFYLDQSENYLAERKIDMLITDVKSGLLSGKISEAELAIAKHRKTERPQSTSMDLITDEAAILRTLYEEDDVLLRFPGVVGDMIGNLCRGDFLGIVAPMKRGKTHWLLDFALRGTLRQFKVLFVSCEMPKKAMVKRAYQAILAETKSECDIEVPYFDEEGFICKKTVSKAGITARKVLSKSKALTKFLKAGGGFKLLCRPANSLNIAELKTELSNLELYDNWMPDIIVLDYADILAPEPDSPKDYRHRIDHTWKAMRKLAQEINGLVITASQSTREGFNKDVTEEGVAEDIRKMAHITHMMVLNQSKEEKKRGIMRVGMLANRSEEFQTDEEVVCLYHYGIGKPFLDSRWKKDCNL